MPVTNSGNAYMPGARMKWPSSTPPPGWLKENGAAISRTAYAALFAVIGTTYGAGDGVTTFNLPDMRGEFERGLDDGKGVDSGRAIGAAQLDAVQGHDHSITLLGGADVFYGFGGNTAGNQPITDPKSSRIGPMKSDGTNGTPRVAAETRPRNVAMLACIKY